MNFWEVDLVRTVGVLGAKLILAHVNEKPIASLMASVTAGVPDEAAFRNALQVANVCVSQVQLDGAVCRAVRRRDAALAEQN